MLEGPSRPGRRVGCGVGLPLRWTPTVSVRDAATAGMRPRIGPSPTSQPSARQPSGQTFHPRAASRQTSKPQVGESRHLVPYMLDHV